MNTGLQKEFSTLMAIASLGLWLNNKRPWAFGLAAAAIGARLMPPTGFSFRNRSVVITGGSRGLGLALAEQLVQEGALVSILARDRDELSRAADKLESFRGVPVLGIVCDVTEKDQLEASFQKVRQHFGTIDILINNAGAISAGPFQTMNFDDFDAQMRLHFYAPLQSTLAILPYFRRKHKGHIVNISSLGGKMAVPHMAPYCASKYALAGFSQAVSTELAQERIQVTTVYPGLMRTGSPTQGVFKGDHEKEFAWFAISDSVPGLTISAKRAARQILDAVRSGHTEVIISAPAKLGIFVSSNFPEIFKTAMRWVNAWLPDGISATRRTGAASQGWLMQQTWARPFVKIMKHAQSTYNEHEKFDADFNLNLKSSI